MAVLNNSALVGASGKGGPGAITTPQRSLRFNSADSAYLSRQFTSAGNQQTWTFSCWLKRGKVNDTGEFTIFGTPLSNNFQVYFGSTLGAYADKLQIGSDPAGYYRVSNAVFRDPSAWYHFVFTLDTNNAVANDRLKVWVNGVELTWQINNVISPGANLDWNSARQHNIGRRPDLYFDGYLANIHFIDGQALTPSAFAYTDPATGRWEPKAYAGSYSGNSFYLDFSDNSAATATTLGADRSGLGNNWVPNNIVAVSNAGQYSSTWTYSATGSNPNGVSDPTGAFLTSSPTIPDNSQQSGRSAYLNHNGGTSWLQLNPSSAIAGSSLRVFMYQPQGTSGADTWINVNGGSNLRPWRVAANYTGWSNTVSIPGGSLTSLRASLSYGGGSNIAIFAIEIDGVILRENSPADIDSLRDHPVSAGIDGGLGGQVSGNYCTLNPLDNPSGVVLTNGNLDHSYPSAAFKSVRGTQMMSSGKWYYEMVHQVAGAMLGIARPSDSISSHLGAVTNAGIGLSNGVVYKDGASIGTGVSLNPGDVLGCAFDSSAGKLWFSVNGTWVNSGNPAAGTNPIISSLTDGTWMPAVTSYNTGSSYNSINFGQRSWAYQAPAGFKALCDTNLPAPVIAKPSTVFQTVLWDGDGASTRTITVGFEPDLIWEKVRNNAQSHLWYDAIRGFGSDKAIGSNSTIAEGGFGDNSGSGYVSGTTSTGFSIVKGSSGAGYMNSSGYTQVAWCWDAGSTTTIGYQPAGATIPANVRANQESGFSIVTYTGTGSAATVGHGLGVAPSLLIVKQRNTARSWEVYHKDLGASYYLELDKTNGRGGPYSGLWNDTSPTSTVFSIKDDGGTNQSSGTYVAYCFAPVAGYSSFGSYTGNGGSQFLYLGFKPRFWMHKRTDTAGSWMIVDSARSSYNVAQDQLYANLSNADSQYGGSGIIDFVSNGVVLRSTGGDVNASGASFVYCAWAENPFKYARAR